MLRLALLLVFVLSLEAADDRAAAEWEIRHNGRVRLAGSPAILDSLDQLPVAPFRLEAATIYLS